VINANNIMILKLTNTFFVEVKNLKKKKAIKKDNNIAELKS